MQTQPSSEHLGSFSSCFRSSVVSAAAVAVTPASNKVCGLSGDVTDTSKAAVLPMTQLGISISAGRVLLWLGVRLLPTSTCTPMWARRHTSTMQSRSLLCLVTTSPPCLHVTAWWLRWSSALPGHKEHWEPPPPSPEVSKPSHHFKATWKMILNTILHQGGGGGEPIKWQIWCAELSLH